MRRFGKEDLEAYLADDWVAALMETANEDDRRLTGHRWLAESPAKRMAFADLYGDLLRGDGQRILDVGGGLSGFTRMLADRHRYELVDLMAHDAPELVARVRASAAAMTVHEVDWFELALDRAYDIVIANDLFPNVDQRLELFLERMLPVCRSVRLLVTYYNRPRFYLTRRIDGDEIMCMLAWNGQMAWAALKPFADRIAEPDPSVFDAQDDSIYPNGRQVCVVRLTGDLSGD